MHPTKINVNGRNIMLGDELLISFDAPFSSIECNGWTWKPKKVKILKPYKLKGVLKEKPFKPSKPPKPEKIKKVKPVHTDVKTVVVESTITKTVGKVVTLIPVKRTITMRVTDKPNTMIKAEVEPPIIYKKDAIPKKNAIPKHITWRNSVYYLTAINGTRVSWVNIISKFQSGCSLESWQKCLPYGP